MTKMKDDLSTVRGCDVSHCSFNKDTACDAAGITVHVQGDHADCVTFRPAN